MYLVVSLCNDLKGKINHFTKNGKKVQKKELIQVWSNERKLHLHFFCWQVYIRRINMTRLSNVQRLLCFIQFTCREVLQMRFLVLICDVTFFESNICDFRSLWDWSTFWIKYSNSFAIDPWGLQYFEHVPSCLLYAIKTKKLPISAFLAWTWLLQWLHVLYI